MSPRLDAALAERGLARSRTHAASLIAQGVVRVDGHPATKPSTAVTADNRLSVDAADHYVSRAAHKLLAGLDAFGVDPAGHVALDMGASTGGFTQVLRERGADPVIAVDVGHGQLAGPVRTDPAVRVVEGFNVRHMTRHTLAAASGVAVPPTIVTGDLSFISLTHVLPAVRDVADPSAEIILLVKPQFEVGRTGIREGIVTDPDLRADAVATVLWAAHDLGLRTDGLIASPIAGTRGNTEFVVHLSAEHGTDPSQWMGTLNRLAGAR